MEEITSSVRSAGAGASVTLQAAGLSVVTHASGADILTGVGGYVAGTMTLATAAAVLIPVTVFVGGAAISVELACAPKSHPNLVKKLKEDSCEYWNEVVEGIPESPTIERAREYWGCALWGNCP